MAELNGETPKSNILHVPEDRISSKKRSRGDTVTCTACSQRLDAYRLDWMRRHPLLDVLLCKRCYQLHSKEIQVGEDGMDEACRWCALEGDLICCDFCHNVFCKLCIRRNLGRAHLNIILNAEEDQKWQCYVCNPEPLVGLVAACSEILKSAEEANESKGTKRLVGLSDLSDEASAGSSPKPKRVKKSKISVCNDESTSVIKNDELEGTVSEKDEETIEKDDNDNDNNNDINNADDDNNEIDDDDEEEEDGDVGLKNDDKTTTAYDNKNDEENEDDIDDDDDDDLKRMLAKMVDDEDEEEDGEEDNDKGDPESDISKEISEMIKSESTKAAASATMTTSMPAAVTAAAATKKPNKMVDGEVVYIKTPTGEIVGLKATTKSMKSINQPSSQSLSEPAPNLPTTVNMVGKRPKGRPRLSDKKSDKYLQSSGSMVGKKYPRPNIYDKNTPSSLAAVAGLKLSSRPPHIDQNNVWNVLERLLAATQSMTMLLTSLKEDLKRTTAVSSGFSGPGKVPDLKKKRKEVAVKLWRAFLAYKKSFIDIEVYTKMKKSKINHHHHHQQQQQQHHHQQQQRQKMKIAKEFLGDDVDEDFYDDKELGDDDDEDYDDDDIRVLLDECEVPIKSEKKMDRHSLASNNNSTFVNVSGQDYLISKEIKVGDNDIDDDNNNNSRGAGDDGGFPAMGCDNSCGDGSQQMHFKSDEANQSEGLNDSTESNKNEIDQFVM